MKKTIVAVTAAAFLGTVALAPAPALAMDPVPLPAIGVLPAMLILGAKENKNFKAVNPYAKKKMSKRSKGKKMKKKM